MFEVFDFFGAGVGLEWGFPFVRTKGNPHSKPTSAPKKSKISNVKQNFYIRSSIPVRYVLVLPENAQNNRITLYSSKRHGVTSKNTCILLERPTFTLRPSHGGRPELQEHHPLFQFSLYGFRMSWLGWYRAAKLSLRVSSSCLMPFGIELRSFEMIPYSLHDFE